MTFLASPLAKWVGGGLVIAVALFFAVKAWNNFTNGLVEKGRAQGRAEITEQYRKQVADNDRVNRQVEAQVEASVQRFADRLSERLKTLDKSAQVQADKIERQIAANPSAFACETPQETMGARNAIRAQGPQ